MSRNDKQVLYNILMDENVVESITENNSIPEELKNKIELDIKELNDKYRLKDYLCVKLKTVEKGGYIWKKIIK